MFTEEGIGLSDKYLINDYVSLNLTLDSDEEKWEKAIDIFSDRIRSRYLNAIQQLNYSDSNGFSIMAIESLLIEVLPNIMSTSLESSLLREEKACQNRSVFIWQIS